MVHSRRRGEAGAEVGVYRFHLDSPIPFTKSLNATIEHGHANGRSDNIFQWLTGIRPNRTRHFLIATGRRTIATGQHAVGGPGTL